MERLRAADTLVLVHPVWNFGMPAILKGFFNRVLVPGVAFAMADGDRGRLTRVMKNIRKVAVVTT
ncbi:NAD(P)H-dependent oxidoreductase [Aureimonas sp. ME7]|uniref:NAD(P)H-dependent oxidoreductase n=1 Tax=Aureimonas sp. ME7 TaxID=2744252 RepID=UPI001FCF27B4|nr:NAD(P)H-dependent oxidoreductase [Aureimonas sp. ME7]